MKAFSTICFLILLGIACFHKGAAAFGAFFVTMILPWIIIFVVVVWILKKIFK